MNNHENLQAAGGLLALHFARCLEAEKHGQDYPDPYETLEQNQGVEPAFDLLSQLLDSCECPRHRMRLVNVIAGLADLIIHQGAEMQIILRRLADIDEAEKATLLVHVTRGNNLHVNIAAELPDFEGMPKAMAAGLAAEIANNLMTEVIKTVVSAILQVAKEQSAKD